MPLHNLLTDRQADARPWVLSTSVQSLKYVKDPRGVARVNANAVVTYGEDPLAAIRAGRDMNAKGYCTVELQRITDQVLKHRPELLALAPDCRKRVVRHRDATLFDG